MLYMFNLRNRFFFLLSSSPELTVCLSGKELPYFLCRSNLINLSHLFIN